MAPEVVIGDSGDRAASGGRDPPPSSAPVAAGGVRSGPSSKRSDGAGNGGRRRNGRRRPARRWNVPVERCQFLQEYTSSRMLAIISNFLSLGQSELGVAVIRQASQSDTTFPAVVNLLKCIIYYGPPPYWLCSTTVPSSAHLSWLCLIEFETIIRERTGRSAVVPPWLYRRLQFDLLLSQAMLDGADMGHPPFSTEVANELRCYHALLGVAHDQVSAEYAETEDHVTVDVWRHRPPSETSSEDEEEDCGGDKHHGGPQQDDRWRESKSREVPGQKSRTDGPSDDDPPGSDGSQEDGRGPADDAVKERETQRRSLVQLPTLLLLPMY
eukprot:Selendium_serpulae@DN3224_c0_g1_i1.p1